MVTNFHLMYIKTENIIWISILLNLCPDKLTFIFIIKTIIFNCLVLQQSLHEMKFTDSFVWNKFKRFLELCFIKGNSKFLDGQTLLFLNTAVFLAIVRVNMAEHKYLLNDSVAMWM